MTALSVNLIFFEPAFLDELDRVSCIIKWLMSSFDFKLKLDGFLLTLLMCLLYKNSARAQKGCSLLQYSSGLIKLILSGF